MKLEEAKKYYTFDDVILLPQYSNITSRKDPDISVDLKNFKYKVPIISAPMNTITEGDMAVTMYKSGGAGVIHRYMSIEKQVGMCTDILRGISNASYSSMPPFYAAIGSNKDIMDRARALYDVGIKWFCVDVANGHNQACIDAVRMVKKTFKDSVVMAGNVCTFNGALNLYNAGADSIRVGVGPGCFSGDTRIMMADGTYKNIKDISVLDKVIGKDGNPVTVIGVRYSGKKKVLKYKNNFWYKETFVTKDHLHWVGDLSDVKNINECSRFHWEPIENCKEKKFLLLPKVINFDIIPDFNIDLTKYAYAHRTMEGLTEFPQIKPTYELGYLFGVFLGDGHAKMKHCTRKLTDNPDISKNTSGSVCFYFNLHEKDIANKTSNFIEKVFNYKPIVKENTKENMTLVVVRSNPVVRFFEQFGKKDTKKLPDILRCSNKEYCKGLYDGLLDSDGCVTKDGCVALINTSRDIVELFQWVHYKTNGYFPSGQERIPPKEHHFGPATNWDTSYCLCSVKRPEFNQTENYQVASINDISETEEVIDTFDIEVDSNDHSFIANNAIVHNSVCTTRLVTGHGAPQLTAIEECAEIKKHSDVVIIADGGIRRSGDAVKAFAAGADAIMIGGLLSGTRETPGDIIKENGSLYKYYHGMASLEGRKEWFKDADFAGVPAEGVSTKVMYTGEDAAIFVDNFASAIKVGLSYSGATTLKELRDNAEWAVVTNAGFTEGTPHGKK